MENLTKEVFYHRYCPTCEFNEKFSTSTNSDGTKTLDICDECHECLNNPSNTYSHKPLYYKEKQT